MKAFRGLYIEDELDNIFIYTELFKLANLELIPVELPIKIDKYHSLVLENDIDFLVIDYNLEKKFLIKEQM